MSERPVAQELPLPDLSANLPPDSLFALVQDIRRSDEIAGPAAKNEPAGPRLTLIRVEDFEEQAGESGTSAGPRIDEDEFRFEDQIERAERMCAEAAAPAVNAEQDIEDELLVPIDTFDLDSEIEVDDSFAAGLDLEDDEPIRAEAEAKAAAEEATIAAAEIVRPSLRIVEGDDVEDDDVAEPGDDERAESEMETNLETDASMESRLETARADMAASAPHDSQSTSPRAEAHLDESEAQDILLIEPKEEPSDSSMGRLMPSGRTMPELPAPGEIAALARGSVASPPRRIGSGQLVPARLTWKPGDPFGEDQAPAASRFRWEVMLTASCITAACGMGFMWLMRTVFSG